MPFSVLNRSIPIPDKRSIPEELQHIGHHLKKARLEKNISIKELLSFLNIDRETLRAWELGLWEPFVKHYPNIISFLGYYPFNHETTTLGGRIKKYRYTHGLTQNDFAVILKTDKSTVSFWETNRRLPVKKTIEALNKLLN